jgi:dipeptidyl aminopeptidase/acylaminoacyl peptidase
MEPVSLVPKLSDNGVYFEQLIFSDEVHDFLCYEDWLRAYYAATNFFDKHLK